MRKGQRFTPTKLNNWRNAGRGTGTFESYRPWHQVTRGDPASRGSSHLIHWLRAGRVFHCLSDMEAEVLGLCAMVPALVDIREQYPLQLHSGLGEISLYSASNAIDGVSGTLDIANSAGVKHPMLHGGGNTVPWTLTTDFVLVVGDGTKRYRIIAVSVKYNSDLGSKRKQDLLKIERAYWIQQGAVWLLITPELYDRRVGRTIRRSLCWGLPKDASELACPVLMQRCTEIGPRFDGLPLSSCLSLIQTYFDVSMPVAQQTFWQAIWRGMLPIDLSISHRPSDRIRLLDRHTFENQNPVLTGRSTCLR